MLRAITDEIGGLARVPRQRREETDPSRGEEHADSPQDTFSDALLSELDRARDGVMRRVVATIQAEQYRVITTDAATTLVVEGGPGTGKTVVGLHRAALLAGRNSQIRDGGILVIAPTRALLAYIRTVLPELGVRDVVHLDLPGLYVGDATVTGTDTAQSAQVKGSAEMTTVLRRALQARIGWPGGDLYLRLGSTTFRVPEQEITDAVRYARGLSLPHNAVREPLRERLIAAAMAAADRSGEAGRPRLAEPKTIRRLSAFTNALDRMWPSFTPESLLRSLFGTQRWLVEACEAVLSADDRAAIYRAPADAVCHEPWTAADLFCLDELSALLDGAPKTFAHVVVDEAQDLSPMQARALARRCPSRSMTLLGDLPQAAGPWIRDSWDELTEHLNTTRLQVATLTVSYRVPESALAVSARQLPLIAPGLTPPRSVRRGDGPVVWERVTVEDGGLQALQRAAELADGGRQVGVLVAHARHAEVIALARAEGVAVGDGGDGDLGQPVTVLPVTQVRGVEFDHVIVVHPGEIVAASPYGRRDLYVALTRCTQQLHVFYDVLPEGMLDPSATTSAPAEDAAPPEWQQAFRSLSADDQRLVEDLILRLARPGA